MHAFVAPDTIEQIPAAMAAAVRSLMAKVDRAAYTKFVNAMIHYTRGSGPRLAHAAEHCKPPQLRAFFADLAKDEAGHYTLAIADLRELGGEEIPLASTLVLDFDKAWYGATDPSFWLGALYALENVAQHLAGDVGPELMRLHLKKTEARFVLTHLTADVEHGAGVAANFVYGDPAQMLIAAQLAARFWVALHTEAFAG
jgi:Iron-containing redox enzyme